MATVKDLTNTTWYIPAGWTATAGYGKFSVNCSSDGYGSGDGFYIGYYDAEGLGSVSPTANKAGIYSGGIPMYSPYNSDSFTVTFTGGSDVTNTSLISWLETHGELQPGGDSGGSGGVTITYNGSVIASLSAGQSATLNCAGKKMTGDIAVTAPADSGGGSGGGESTSKDLAILSDVWTIGSSISGKISVSGTVFASSVSSFNFAEGEQRDYRYFEDGLVSSSSGHEIVYPVTLQIELTSAGVGCGINCEQLGISEYWGSATTKEYQIEKPGIYEVLIDSFGGN